MNHLLDVAQVDIGQRGLARDAVDNLITRTVGDFERACQSIALASAPRVGIITGFMIPSVEPPTGETDGPLGTLFLAKAFRAMGIDVVLASDAAGYRALVLGCEWLGLSDVSVIDLRVGETWEQFGKLTHLIALERSGPNSAGQNCTMRGLDITPYTMPAHRLFEGERDYVTIGIGDGGNEIGMGNIPLDVIAKNIPNGDAIACRTPVDHLIVCGISNWGGYALAAGVLQAKGMDRPDLFDVDQEERLLTHLVQQAPLIDGVTRQFTATVDGITFDRYAEPLRVYQQQH